MVRAHPSPPRTTNTQTPQKLSEIVNYRVRVILVDSSELNGTLLAFDRHMNLVLKDTEQFRLTRTSQGALRKAAAAGQPVPEVEEVRRTLGLVVLRGGEVVLVSAEKPPATTTAASTLTGPAAPTKPGFRRA